MTRNRSPHPARALPLRTWCLAWTAALLLMLSMAGNAKALGTRDQGVLDVECIPPSSSNVVYNPPLTNVPQPVVSTQNWQLGPCVSASKPALTSGTHSQTSLPRDRTCFDLLAAGPETKTITWNTGETSTLSMNRTVSVAGAALIVTHTGTVTSGLFAGDSVLITETGVATAITLCTLGLGSVGSVYSQMTLTTTSL
ncbi:hypothetical protein [Streptomyces sp. ODS05-4]|uniref:hypothetical protein n=1 Tax=Streptomyces sp. ODS05-4 TaxID=2944939 RepID=UPI00210F1E91|nr:hypothetical protein [Streptomyces sp. ODS05-4]